MTLEADITAVAGPVVSGRIYPTAAALNTPRPYITYQQIGGDGGVHLLDHTVVPGKEHAMLQFNVWADTAAAAKAKARELEAAMRAATAFTARPLGAFVDDHNPDLGRYGARHDYSIWSDRT